VTHQPKITHLHRTSKALLNHLPCRFLCDQSLFLGNLALFGGALFVGFVGEAGGDGACGDGDATTPEAKPLRQLHIGKLLITDDIREK
jgi:hypothetical protein